MGHLFCLPPGTRVQDWLLLGCHGHGGFGVVYRAVRIGHESEGPVALKMALVPWEPRFMREVGLLSLVRHPNIPRLLGHGFWRHPSGAFFPFIVMEWVEGTALYEWAREHHPTHRQQLQVLAPIQPWKQRVASKKGGARVLAGALLVLWTLAAAHAPLPSASARKQVASNPAPPRDGGAARLGESASEFTEPWGRESFEPEALSQDTPPKPFPGQITPDAKSQCPGRTQIPINGGCWMELSTKDAEACEEAGYVFFRARCYAPAWTSRRKPPPTSAPPDFR